MINLLRTTVISLTILLPIAASAESGHALKLADQHTLSGSIPCGEDLQVAVEIVDRDLNGRFDDGVDRLFIDIDADGHFHPLRERFAASGVLRIRGLGKTGQTDRYQFHFNDSDRSQTKLVPIFGEGTLIASVTLDDPNAKLTKITATLVSQAGIHCRIDAADTATTLPTGRYRIDDLQLEITSEQNWLIALKNFGNRNPFWIDVKDGETTAIDLLGKLSLSASVKKNSTSGDRLMIQPTLKSETGLTLIKSLVGHQRPDTENKLTAFWVRKSPKTVTAMLGRTDDASQVLDMGGSGFACGQFCPIGLETNDAIGPNTRIMLEFDSGPLAGFLTATETASVPE